MVDLLLDSDLIIWHLRGHPAAVEYLRSLSARGRFGISTITRTEVLAGARPREIQATEAFLDACESIPPDTRAADLAATWIREGRAAGRTVDVPDALIGATASGAAVPLHTCNPRHFGFPGLHVVGVEIPPRQRGGSPR
jgi:predicted nucleic acid-binding protein